MVSTVYDAPRAQSENWEADVWLPMPSCPYRFHPKVHKLPSWPISMLCRQPQATLTIVVDSRLETKVGVNLHKSVMCSREVYAALHGAIMHVFADVPMYDGLLWWGIIMKRWIKHVVYFALSKESENQPQFKSVERKISTEAASPECAGC